MWKCSGDTMFLSTAWLMFSHPGSKVPKLPSSKQVFAQCKWRKGKSCGITRTLWYWWLAKVDAKLWINIPVLKLDSRNHSERKEWPALSLTLARLTWVFALRRSRMTCSKAFEATNFQKFHLGGTFKQKPAWVRHVPSGVFLHGANPTQVLCLA